MITNTTSSVSCALVLVGIAVTSQAATVADFTQIMDGGDECRGVVVIGQQRVGFDTGGREANSGAFLQVNMQVTARPGTPLRQIQAVPFEIMINGKRIFRRECHPSSNPTTFVIPFHAGILAREEVNEFILKEISGTCDLRIYSIVCFFKQKS
jgi:hypothetical protein